MDTTTARAPYLEDLGHLHLWGNNAWGGPIDKKMPRAKLDQLLPRVSGAEVLGYMLARGHSDRGIRNLETQMRPMDYRRPYEVD